VARKKEKRKFENRKIGDTFGDGEVFSTTEDTEKRGIRLGGGDEL
jgi:hypothetical protein